MLAALPTAEQHATRHRIIAPELREPAQLPRPDDAAALDLDGEQPVAPVGDEVDLRSRRRAPREQPEIERPVGDMGAQLLMDERLEGRPVDLLGAVEGAGRPDCPVHAGVEQEELGMRGHPAPGPPGEDGHARGDQQVLQQVEVGDGRLAVHPDVARDLGHVEQRGLREAGALEEPAERREVPGPPFFDDFLAQVALDVGRQVAGRVGLGVDGRELAVDHRAFQREVGARLDRGQGIQMMGARPSRQQVDAAAAQAARARSGQDETPPLGLDQAVDLVEDQRNPLHLVQHDPVVVPRRNQLSKAVGPRQQVEVERMVEQIEVQRVRKPLPEPGRLAGAAGTEEEKALAGFDRSFQHSGIHTPILHGYSGVSLPEFTSQPHRAQQAPPRAGDPQGGLRRQEVLLTAGPRLMVRPPGLPVTSTRSTFRTLAGRTMPSALRAGAGPRAPRGGRGPPPAPECTAGPRGGSPSCRTGPRRAARRYRPARRSACRGRAGAGCPRCPRR